jgi:hypothetical protein
MPANCWRSNTLGLCDGNYGARGVLVYGHSLQALAQPALQPTAARTSSGAF